MASDGSLISGTTSAGFTLTAAGNQLMCLVGDGGTFLPNLTVVMGPRDTPCAIDEQRTNDTHLFVLMPPLSQFCSDEACLLRGKNDPQRPRDAVVPCRVDDGA